MLFKYVPKIQNIFNRAQILFILGNVNKNYAVQRGTLCVKILFPPNESVARWKFLKCFLCTRSTMRKSLRAHLPHKVPSVACPRSAFGPGQKSWSRGGVGTPRPHPRPGPSPSPSCSQLVVLWQLITAGSGWQLTGLLFRSGRLYYLIFALR